ncbi:MAG: hypothetical protein V4574_03530 [Pseudomonadota bacterium]
MISRALAAAGLIALAQDAGPVKGDATAGLVSRQAKGEVHLVSDPALADGRLVLRVVILNHGAEAAAFGPANVSVALPDGTPVALVPRETLLAEQTGAPSGRSSGETSQAHSTASLATNGQGQTDVTSYTGAMSVTTAGVPQSTLDRAQRADPQSSAAWAALDAVLLKPITLRPGAADGGQVVTARLKRGKGPLTVTIAFAGEAHRFEVAVPKK